MASVASGANFEISEKMADQEFRWIENNGVYHISSPSSYIQGVYEGRFADEKLKKMTKELLEDGVFNDEDYQKVIKEFRSMWNPDSLTILPELDNEEKVKEASTEFVEEFKKSAEKEKGSIEGVAIRMKKLSGEYLIPKLKDFIIAVPADPEILYSIKQRDFEKEKKRIQDELVEILKNRIAEGEKELKKELKIIENTGAIPPDSKAAEIKKQMMFQYSLSGELENFNEEQVIADYIEKGALADYVKRITPTSKSSYSEKEMPAGRWIIYYDQDFMSYLYVIEIKPGEKTTLNLFRIFDHTRPTN